MKTLISWNLDKKKTVLNGVPTSQAGVLNLNEINYAFYYFRNN